MKYSDIDIKKLLSKFGKEYDFIYNANKAGKTVAGEREALEFFDRYMDTNKDFVNFVKRVVKVRGDFFSSDREIIAFMFALDSMGLLDAIEQGDLTEKCGGKKKNSKLKKFFDFTGDIDRISEIMEEEFRNAKGGVFGNSDHWKAKVSDEGLYLTISAVADFLDGNGFTYQNSKVQKQIDSVLNELYDFYPDDVDFMDAVSELEPILLEIAINLKERIMYATVDLGNNLGNVEVGRTNLPEDGDEKGLRKAMRKLIESF